jgi:hypothetical protein
VHNPLSVADLVNDELRQRRESGYEVSAIEADLARELTDDHDHLEAQYLELITTRRRPDWHYEEPSLLEEIVAAMPGGNRERPVDAGRSPEELVDRVLGGWQGRIAGCNLGKPIEDGDFWTPGRIRTYLELAGAYPLRDYIPALDPMPDGFRLRECWPETTRAHVHGGARDDDIDYSILNLLGAAKLPPHFIKPLQDRTRSAVVGYDNSRISDLARRTASLAEHGLRSDAGDHASSAG